MKSARAWRSLAVIIMQRKAGVVLPLFSIRTRRDWGIGQITDLPACAEWIRGAGHRLLQILPPHELSAGETSPYGALTAFGLDPIYVDIESVEDLDAATVAEALGEEGRTALAAARAAPRVDYESVRKLKARALALAFERFHAREWLPQTARAKRLAQFQARERSWLDDLVAYDVLRESHAGWGWTTWPAGEREHSARTVDEARARAGRRALSVAYVQWIALEQWERAHAQMRAMGVELMGDLPFIVCAESADVWSHASRFRLDVSLGAPPDAYSAEGQDWGLPAYDWKAMDSDDLAWIRARAAHAGRLYDRFRLDHVVGYFRQWVRPASGAERGRFDPETEPEQDAQGRQVLGAVLDALRNGSARGGVEPPRVIAEDLGMVPPFVREALGELGMPGYRVLPWEKDDDGQFRDPLAFPELSVASWSTHDTAPIVAWWGELPQADRAQLAERAEVEEEMDDEARSLALLGDLYRARSELALVLAQELLAVRDRINTPATVGLQNWTWRLPAPIEDLRTDARVVARFAAIRELIDASGR
jgi:4-alpha-glucanotransferase